MHHGIRLPGEHPGGGEGRGRGTRDDAVRRSCGAAAAVTVFTRSARELAWRVI